MQHTLLGSVLLTHAREHAPGNATWQVVMGQSDMLINHPAVQLGKHMRTLLWQQGMCMRCAKALALIFSSNTLQAHEHGDVCLCCSSCRCACRW